MQTISICIAIAWAYPCRVGLSALLRAGFYPLRISFSKKFEYPEQNYQSHLIENAPSPVSLNTGLQKPRSFMIRGFGFLRYLAYVVGLFQSA